MTNRINTKSIKILNMNHQRYNLFNLIHKGLRHLMYDTALKIQVADFSTLTGAAPVINQIEQVLLFFEEHAHHEDNEILPFVTRFDPDLVADFKSQHEEDHRLGNQIVMAVTGWKVAEGSVARLKAGRKIFYHFNEFVAFNLAHMNKEEHLINAVLWKNYSDEELHAATQRIIQRIKPQILFEESRWMMKSINVREALDWLTGIKISAPAEVFKVFLKMAHEELPPEKWLSIKESLFEEILITENLN